MYGAKISTRLPRILAMDNELQICVTCGTQFDTEEPKDSCVICDDPRQYVLPTGPSFSTLRKLQGTRKNVFTPVPKNPYATSISTEPKCGIGQRAVLIKVAEGKKNILWDCIAYLDDATVSEIKKRGGIDAIIISHPHYYTTSGVWADVFGCKVYASALDKQWMQRITPRHVFFDGPLKAFTDWGVQVPVVGGHFPGSLVLCHENRLYTADSIAVALSGLYEPNRPPGTVYFSFMWSYPNLIPLSAKEVAGIWTAVKELQFEDVHGAFVKTDIYGRARAKVKDSARIVIERMGGDVEMVVD